MWSEPCLGVLVLEPLGRDSDADQNQLSFLSILGPPCGCYKVICGLVPLVLGLKILERDYAVSKAG